MSVRAKFKLTEIRHHYWAQPQARTLHFEAQCDQNTPENQRFYDATPTGHFEMLCNNPVALDQFELGHDYYFDITPAEA